MPTETLPIRKTQSIFDELENRRNQIMRRAYEIFDGNGRFFGKDLDDWFHAERELVWKPSIELREKDEEFILTIAVPGIDAKDLDIEVTPEDLLVRGEVHHECQEETKEDKGKVHACEFQSGSLFRAVHFPKEIDPEKVKAEFKNGVLTIKASIAAEERPKKVKVEAA